MTGHVRRRIKLGGELKTIYLPNGWYEQFHRDILREASRLKSHIDEFPDGKEREIAYEKIIKANGWED